MQKDIQTIFLAAGKSSRMHPISDKNFLEFLGEPLLLKLLKNAHEGGLKHFVIVGNDENIEKIKNICNENEFLKDSIVTKQENQKDGMAGGILEGLKHVSNENELFILGGNDFVDAEIYSKIIHKSKDFDGGILAKKVDHYFPGGYLNINENRKILKIQEKPKEGNEPSNLVNIIGHYFKNVKALKKQLKNISCKDNNGYEQALHNLFKKSNFLAVEYSDFWHTIKYPWHVLEISEAFIKNELRITNFKLKDFEEISSSVFVHKTAKIANSVKLKEGPIFIDEGASVLENAVIIGPCYIGKNAIIGNNALVRNSNIGENSVIGYNTEIARSFLGKNINTHIAYIGDSIIDDSVNIGAYTCTANLRLDKKNIKVTIIGNNIDSGLKKLGAIIAKDCQIGIHTMLMPGVKIEKNISPGMLVK